MTKAINWRRAQLASKPKTSVADEKEWRDKDAAARWLERKDKRNRPAPSKPSREGAAAQ